MVLALGLFVVAYGTNVSTPFLVLYRDRLDLSPSQTMAIFVVYVAGILGTLLLAGPLSDRFGRRPVVVPMVVITGLGSLVMIAGRDNYGLLLLGRLLLGVASGGALGVGTAWLLELLGKGSEQRAAVMATVVTFGGFGIGPPISALFEWLLPAPLVLPFLLHAALAALAAATMLRVPETRPPNPGAPVRIALGVPEVARRRFALVVVPAAIWVFCFPSTSFALFPVLLSEAVGGGQVAVAAGSGALTAWAGLLARPVLNRVGPRVLLPAGVGLGVLGYVSGTIAFAADAWPMVLIAAPLLGGASGAITASSLTLLGEMADDARRGALTSTFYLLAYPGMAMPLLITSLASVTTMSTALVIITTLAAAFFIVVLIASRTPALHLERVHAPLARQR